MLKNREACLSPGEGIKRKFNKAADGKIRQELLQKARRWMRIKRD